METFGTPKPIIPWAADGACRGDDGQGTGMLELIMSLRHACSGVSLLVLASEQMPVRLCVAPARKRQNSHAAETCMANYADFA